MADNETGESEGDARDEIHEPEPQLRHGVPQAFDPMGVELLFPNADQLLDLIETLGHEGFAMLLDVCGAMYVRIQKSASKHSGGGGSGTIVYAHKKG